MTTALAPSVATLLADSTVFRAWLQSGDINRVVGHCAQPGACPLAAFLAAHGFRAPSVGKYDVGYFTERGKWYQELLPEWASAFVRAIDAMFPISYYGKHACVIAEEALSVLDAVLKDQDQEEPG